MLTREAVALILVVDDERVVVRVIRVALERVGHRVETAHSAAEASEAAARMERIDVLIIDHRIPPDQGRAIAERLLLTHPEMKVMHISGWPRERLEAEGSLMPGAAFLYKPFTPLQMQSAVAALLASQTGVGSHV